MRKTSRSIRIILALTVCLQVVWAGISPAEAAPQTPSADVTFSLTLSPEEKVLFDDLMQIKNLIEQVHPTGASMKAIYEGMIRGLLDSLNDPYSSYLTQDELVSFTSSFSDTYTGIGVTITVVDEKVTVMSVLEGSPAEAAGVQAEDIILSVNGQEFGTLEEASNALRGYPGTSVTMLVSRPSTGDIISFSITRAVISTDRLRAEDLGDGLYFLKIGRFTDGVLSQFPSEMERIKAAGARGLVLDLRSNPGGLLDAGVEVAKHLIPKGPVVILQGKSGQQTILNNLDTQPIPVVILVNGGTASSSEIVAGAVRDTGVGRLVGTKTYGKGCIQQVAALGDNLGGIRLTTANYLTPSGRAIGGVGLEPDVIVEAVRINAPNDIRYKRDMKPGMVGLDVLALQENLNFLGYNASQPDGVYGPATAAAVSRFLADQKATYRGIVGVAEVELITKATNQKAMNPPDTVREKGIEVLRARVTEGEWKH
ncbi:MAG: S41 family peptidase [Bacillota bacterium]